MNSGNTQLLGILLGVFALISVIASVVTVLDKVRAIRHEWRIPENTLLLIAAAGGAPAMLITMLIIRHKTRHGKFMVGLPIILLFQIIVLLWCNFRLGLF
jgi:uncharacterized membrane protein YsdA (DUF1294 family)